MVNKGLNLAIMLRKTKMRIERVLIELDRNFFKLKDKDDKSKLRYITYLVSKVNLDNPHYKISTRQIYNLLREKFLKFAEESNFKCLKCEDSCCYFNKEEFYYKNVGIYNEDYELLAESNLDLLGYVVHRGWNNFDHILVYLQRLGLTEIIKKFEKISKEDLLKVIRLNLEILGYKFDLEFIKFEDSKYKCYYYDENNKSCKIHQYKPIVCLTYPFRVVNELNFVGIAFADDCNFLKAKYTASSFEDYLKETFKLKSFWEYQIVAMLFLLRKGQICIHNNVIMRDRIEKITEFGKEIYKIFNSE